MEANLELILKQQEPQSSQPKTRKVSSRGRLRLLKAKITDRDKADFCTQLSVMLQARVSLHRALEVLIGQTTKVPMKEVIREIASEVQKGSSFDKALATRPDVFDKLFIVSAEVGQESGRLAQVLAHLAGHLEKMSALKRKFLQALTYPALVITVATGAVTFLLVFIVPTFADMFKTFQIELPLSTRLILSLSRFLSFFGPYLLVGSLVGLYLSRETLRRPSVREKMAEMSLKLPLLGEIILKTHVARFCRTLGTLLQAQVSLVEALGVSERIATSGGIRRQIGAILKHVRQGRAIAEPLVDSTLFPPMVVQMIAVGEETSELDTMLLKVADYYEQEIDGKVDALTTIMEPVIVLFLGFVVAAILISMYLPMFDLVNVVGGG
jgi:type IV pilus assembly protein PilC